MMDDLIICGETVRYDADVPYGMLYSDSDGTRSYAGFHPDSLEDTARAFGGDETITTLAMLLRKMLEDSEEPADEEWGKIKHTTEGGKPKSEKNKALARTRGLLKKAIKAVNKAAAKSGKK